MTNEVSNTLDQLNNLNEQLFALPSGTLTFLLVLLASFTLRWWHLFPDKYVAPLSTFGGMIFFGLTAPYDAMHMRIWLAKNAAFGFIISATASVLMLKFGERIPWIGRFLKPTGNTEFLSKQKTEPKKEETND